MAKAKVELDESLQNSNLKLFTIEFTIEYWTRLVYIRVYVKLTLYTSVLISWVSNI